MAHEVKDGVRKRRRGYTRISAKNQVTLPVDALQAAGLSAGQELKVEVDGAGRLVLSRAFDRRRAIEETAGSMPGVWEPGYLDKLRDEWR
jgi:bifunctional DNA-binding transcriptional regulator/antitoxin component of YhaV-PrlF toxin-antitoxin module